MHLRSHDRIAGSIPSRDAAQHRRPPRRADVGMRRWVPKGVAMSALLVATVVLSGLLAYIVGYAFRAPRHSFLRSMTGGVVLAGFVLTILLLPPTLMSLGSADGALAWPDTFDRGLYRGLWIAMSTLGLLAGLRVWRMRGRPSGAPMFTLDESPVSRAEAQLPLADSLEEALDVLGREKLGAKDVERCAAQLRRVGSRFWFQVPEKNSDAYRLVSAHVPAAIAAPVTGLLLEGAARK